MKKKLTVFIALLLSYTLSAAALSSDSQAETMNSINSISEEGREVEAQQFKAMSNQIKSDFSNPFFTGGADNSQSGGDANGKFPVIKEIKEENRIILQFIVPGISENNLKVKISGNLLIVSGIPDSSISNIVTPKFTQQVVFPKYVDSSKIKESYDSGVLTIFMPKSR